MSRFYDAVIRRMLKAAGRVWDVGDDGHVILKAATAEQMSEALVWFNQFRDDVRKKLREEIALEIEKLKEVPFEHVGYAFPIDAAISRAASIARGER